MPHSHPFLSTTYQLHRISPLYKFPTLNPAEHPLIDGNASRNRIQSPFKTHERALTNILKGEVLRGVHVATGDDSFNEGGGELGKLGRFMGCRWRLVPTIAALREYNAEEALREDMDDEDEEENNELAWIKAVREREDVSGVEISFEYERGVGGYVAYFVGPPESQTDDGQFTYLPLVLTRLPKPLMETLFDYLATTFDTLVVPLGVVDGNAERIQKEIASLSWLGEMLEMYVGQMKGRVDKDIVLSYKVPKGQGSGIKIITIGLAKGDIVNFVKYGKELEPRVPRVQRKRKREGDGGGQDAKRKGPFTLAVEKHIEATMGMDITKLVLTKIACGGFVVGGSVAPTVGNGEGMGDVPEHESMESSGRIKIFVPKKFGMQDDEDNEDGTGDVEGRSTGEIVAENFMNELVQLAIHKGGIQIGGFGNGKTDGPAEVSINGRKLRPTIGRVPRGRVEIS